MSKSCQKASLTIYFKFLKLPYLLLMIRGRCIFYKNYLIFFQCNYFMKMLIFWANINKEKVTIVLHQYIDFQCAFKELLTLRLCFKLVHLRHDIAHNSTRFITCSKFILQILTLNNFFIKNYCLSCTLLPSCDHFRNPSRPLGAPIVLNQMRFVGNFISGKFYSTF